MQRILAIIALPLMLSVTSTSLSAESRLMGNLETDAGVPIKGFPIIIQGQNSQSVAISNSDGEFEVDLPGAGVYQVIVPTQQQPWRIDIPELSDTMVDIGTINISPF
jgi:hypothetical protein